MLYRTSGRRAMRRVRGRFDDQARRKDTPTGVVVLETLTDLGARQPLQRGERAEALVTR
jgi:hypothetical protein